MSNLYEGEGKRISVTAGTAGRTSGDVVVVRAGATGKIGVSLTTVAASTAGEVELEGVFRLPKDTTTALGIFAVGAFAYWDVAAGEINSQASANVLAGMVVEAAGAADTTVKVKLNPT